MEKGLPFHWLMEHTDPALVHCELDVFWAAKGSTDPLACLKKYPGRYPILHLKDMTNDEAATFACVGSGRIDFPGILREAARQKIRHYFVEQDRVTDGLACLQEAGAYLQKVRF
jgi:sugar phosphate isomerase/epimerase